MARRGKHIKFKVENVYPTYESEEEREEARQRCAIMLAQLFEKQARRREEKNNSKELA